MSAFRTGIGFLALPLTSGLSPMRHLNFNRIVRRLKRFLLQPESALNLGVLRFVLSGFLLSYVRPERVLDYSQLPADLMVPPYGMGFFVDVVPVNYDVTVVALVGFYVLGLASTLGLATRYSLPVFTVCAFYVLTVPQLFGKVNHYHHLLWFLFLLSLSPSGDSFSIDALIDDERSFLNTESSTAYGLPLKLCWLLIGIVYFFPGFWKLWENGIGWVLGDHLRLTLYHKWYEVGATPVLRIDRYPLLLNGGATLTLLFELGFILAVFQPYTRLVFVILGLIFHTATRVFMFISFTSLLITYVVFLDWSSLLGSGSLPSKLLGWVRLNGTASSETSSTGRGHGRVTGRILLAGVFLILVTVAAGVTSTTAGWPFACYPTFADKPDPDVWSLQFGIQRRSGERILTTPELRNRLGVPTDRFKGPVRNLLHGETFESFETRVREILTELRKSGFPLENGTPVTVYSVKRSVHPDRDSQVLKRNTVTTVRVP